MEPVVAAVSPEVRDALVASVLEPPSWWSLLPPMPPFRLTDIKPYMGAMERHMDNPALMYVNVQLLDLHPSLPLCSQ